MSYKVRRKCKVGVNDNCDTSNETKRETNYSINNKCNDVNTRNTHIT